MADIHALIRLYADMIKTKNPTEADFFMARTLLQQALAEDLRIPRQFSSEREELSAKIKMLLAGDLFPPKEYQDKSGRTQVWDDRIFFEKMLKWSGHWTSAQISTIKRRIDLYNEKGHEIPKTKQSPPGELAPVIGDDMPF